MTYLQDQKHLTIRKRSFDDPLSGFHQFWSTSPLLSGKLVDDQNFDCNVDIIQSKEGNMHIALTSKNRALIAQNEIKISDIEVMDLLDDLCTKGTCLIPNPWHTSS